MQSVKIWLHAFRLRTLPLSLSGIIVGTALANSYGYFNLTIFALCLITTLLFQILSNLANDLGDFLKGTDNLNRIGPDRAVQSGQISVKQMKKALLIFIILSLCSSLLLIYYALFNQSVTLQITYLLLAILSILSALFYTLGKKAYGYLGLGDVFVFLFFGLLSVLGSYSLYSHQFLEFNILPACMIGFFSTAVLNLNNMRDYENDKNCNKKTLVVQIGLKKAKIYHLILLSLGSSCLVVYAFVTNEWLINLCLFPILFIIKHAHFVKNVKNEKELDSQLKVLAIITFFISILMFVFSFFAR